MALTFSLGGEFLAPTFQGILSEKLLPERIVRPLPRHHQNQSLKLPSLSLPMA